MLRRCFWVILLAGLLLIGAGAPRAEAGVYEVQVCANGNRTGNQDALTWATDGAGAPDIWSRPFGTGCIDGAGLIQNWSGADAPQGAVAVYGMNAPSGTSFTSAAWQQLIQIAGGGSRCVYASDSAGTMLGSTQTCLSNSFFIIDSGWVQQSWSGSSGSFQLRTACVFGPCNGGGGNQITSEFSNLGARITDNTAPSLSNGSGLWSTSSWVRGSWSLGWDASDSMGIKTHRYYIDNVSQDATLVCNPNYNGEGIFYGSTIVACPGTTSSSASYTANTASYSDGSHTLKLSSFDATSDGSSNQGTDSKTIYIDNSAPGTPTISGPSSETNDTTPTFTFSASDPQSGISGYECSVDGGAYFACSSPYTVSSQGDGEHDFAVRAKNNAQNSSGVVATGDVNSLIYALSTTPPSALFATTPANPTNADPLVYTLNFDQNVNGLEATDFTKQGTATGCSVSVSGNSGSSFTVNLSGCSEGTAGITLKANSVTDDYGNTGPSADLVAAPVTIDRTKPTAYWTEPASPTSDLTLDYTLVFSEPVTGIEAGDFQNQGTASGCIFTPSNSSGTAITVSVSGCSEGTVIAQLNANSVSDALGNIGPSSPRQASPVIIDRSGPTASWTTPVSPTNASTLNYTLTTNETVSGMSDGAISVSGSATGCSASVSGSSGSSFPVTVSGCSEGTVIVTLTANTLTDNLGNIGPASPVSSTAVTIDRTAPTLTWTNPTSPTKATNVTYTLNFSEKINNLTSGDLSAGGTANDCLLVPQSSSGTTINVTASGCSEGTVNLTLTQNSVEDDAGNSGPASNSTSGTVTIDRSPASASWTEPVSPTKATTMDYTLTFDEAITGLASGDFSFAGTATGCSASPDAASGTSFTITVSGCSAGTVVISLNKQSVSDPAGNASPASTTPAGAVTIDRTPATASWVEPASPTKATTMNYTLIFDKAISGLASGDFSFAGTASGCSANTSAASGTTFTITVSGCSSGTVIISLNKDAVSDAIGNLSPASATPAGTVTIDRNPATASWVEPTSPTNATDLIYTLNFDEPVSGLSSADFTLAGSATGCSVARDSSSGTSFAITVSGCSEGTVIITLLEDTVQDEAGNWSPAAKLAASSVTIDRTVPTASWTSQPSSPTNASNLIYNLSFSKSISGLSASSFALAGTASGCIVNPDASSGTSFVITVSSCSEGELNLALLDQAVQDAAGNLAPATPLGTNPVTIDRSPATVSWTEPASPTKATTLSYQLDFNKPVTGLTSADFTNEGSATGCLFAVAGSGTSYTIEASSCSEGTVIVRLLADATEDAAGNKSPQSNSEATVVTIDRSPATASWTAPASPATSLPLDYVLSFDENVSGLESSDLENIGDAEGCTFSLSASSGTSFTVSIDNCKAGTVIPRLKAETVEDDAGNKSPQNNSDGASVDYQTAPNKKTAPSISGQAIAGQELTADDGQWYGTAPITFTYQWQRCLVADPDDCTSIGATSKSYTLTAADAGFLIRVDVTATNLIGPSTERSGPTAMVAMPEPKITKSPASPASSGDIEWSSVTGSESLCAINDGPYELCTSPFSIDGYPEGEMTFRVKQRSNDQDSSAAEVSFRIDRTAPPAPEITEHPANPTNQTSAPFRFIGEDGASFQCRWDDGAWSVCASPDSRNNMALGDHSYEVRQLDLAGNVSPAVRWSWKIVNYDPNNLASKVNTGSGRYTPTNSRTATMTCGVNRGSFETCYLFSFAAIKQVSYKKTSYCKSKKNRNKSSCKQISYRFISVGKATVTNKDNLGAVEVKVKLNSNGRRLLRHSRGPLLVRTNYRVVLPDGRKLTSFKLSYFMPPEQRLTVLYGHRLYQQSGRLTSAGRNYIRKITNNVPKKVKAISCYGYSSASDRAFSYRIAARRAQSICAYIKDRQKVKARYRTRSYGNSRPRASNKTSSGRTLNNRAIIKIIYY